MRAARGFGKHFRHNRKEAPPITDEIVLLEAVAFRNRVGSVAIIESGVSCIINGGHLGRVVRYRDRDFDLPRGMMRFVYPRGAAPRRRATAGRAPDKWTRGEARHNATTVSGGRRADRVVGGCRDSISVEARQADRTPAGTSRRRALSFPRHDFRAPRQKDREREREEGRQRDGRVEEGRSEREREKRIQGF